MASVRQDIAIIGTGCRFPDSVSSPSQLWDLLMKPKVVAQQVPSDRFNIEGFYHEEKGYHGHGSVREAYFLSDKGAHRSFDAPFFGIKTAEANVLDPQIRLLLETTYEALEASGLTMESLRGSDTALYVGQMMADYEMIMLQDPDFMGKYHATGTSRAMTANRISYFFDWRGPSMTIDTACSSSLVAVHEAVRQLRTSQSRVAVAAGVNLLLSPNPFISESKLQMLSEDGRCRMWDVDAKGYARGEGIAAIVLKKLEDAVADGDDIECIIRETNVNTDGRTLGITMPSATAQIELMRHCYQRAGLDPTHPLDRPQYFEAHGTGTRVGDPIEAEAISSTFFPESYLNGEENQNGDNSPKELLVGSIKTVLGHTEGSAGLAGILKASLALQHATIPPNLFFNQLNPDIVPYYKRLEVPTQAEPWPGVQGGVRRVSVNSFGFGGANAHAILESFTSSELSVSDPRPHPTPLFSPFVFSAASSSSLLAYLSRMYDHLQRSETCIDARDLAYTLHSKRSRHSVGIALSADSSEGLCIELKETIQEAQKDSKAYFKSTSSLRTANAPRILGVFTGQGAQWARMGHDLLSASEAAQRIIARLEDRLSQLPDGPQWSLSEELSREPSTSRLDESAICQPACTVIQILQVELLRAAELKLSAVVGHSSGEIAAAYAAGWISAEDAICIAYYRGLHSNLAGHNGRMLAVEGSIDDVKSLCDEPYFRGRVCIAAVNSPTSFTISGDSDAITEIHTIFQDEEKFSRLLKVDKAYHSHHMSVCSAPYLESLGTLNIHIGASHHCNWYSSVHGQSITGMNGLTGRYWEENMSSPVLFMQALQSASDGEGLFDLAIEIGPHSALKAPVTQTLNQVLYTNLFTRGRPSLKSCAESLGYVWTKFGGEVVHLRKYDEFLSANAPCRLLKGLPTYSWDHQLDYWHQSRFTQAHLNRKGPAHSLLGHIAPNSTPDKIQWRHVLSLDIIPWLDGHRVHNQMIFPAAGYVSMALEATIAAFGDSSIDLIEILDLHIEHALVFDEKSSFEILFSLDNIVSASDGSLQAKFRCYSAHANRAGHEQLRLHAGGRLRTSVNCSTLLPTRAQPPPHLLPVDNNQFYKCLNDIGYHYDGSFTTLHSLQRRSGFATGSISAMEPPTLLVHPATLDVAFQTTLLAYSAPGDGSLWIVHVPSRIHNIKVNVGLCRASANQQTPWQVDGFLPDKAATTGDIDIYPHDTNEPMIQTQGLVCVPLSSSVAADDAQIFSTLVWDVISPDTGALGQLKIPHTSEGVDKIEVLERMAGFFLRKLEREVPLSHPARQVAPYKYLLNYAGHVISQQKAGKVPRWSSEWELDRESDVHAASLPYANTVEVSLLDKIGHNLAEIVDGTKLPIELGMQGDLLAGAYAGGLGVDMYVSHVARLVRQMTHRCPNMDIIEVGAGTGVTTKRVLREIGHKFRSYTFTDVSAGFFDSPMADLEPYELIFKQFDLAQDPVSQGFIGETYDLIIASLVLHATPSLASTMEHCRKLLKPGGHIIVLELLPAYHTSIGVVFGAFPGWWAGVEDGRVLTPAISVSEWDELLRHTGFSGCDTTTPHKDDSTQLVVFASQAIDEKIAFLRQPLSSSQPSPVDLGDRHLIIIGAEGPHLQDSIVSLQSLLRPHCQSITYVEQLARIDLDMISQSATILSLADLGSPVFKFPISHEVWNAIKKILLKARSVIWVTHGRLADEPYSNMIPGLVRSAVRERPGLKYLFLEIEKWSQSAAKFIAESVLRHKAGTYWQHQNATHVTVESDIMLDHADNILIPRLVMNHEMNDRYNSRRRPIIHPLTSSETTEPFHVVKEGPSFVVYRAPSIGLQKDAASPPLLTTIRALLYAVKISEFSSMFLMLAESSRSDRYVVLSPSCSSLCSSPLRQSVPVEVTAGRESQYIVLVTYHLIISQALSGLTSGDVILVYQPDRDLAQILYAAAKLKGVDVVAVTETEEYDSFEGIRWIRVHSNAPDRVLNRLIPGKTALFLDLVAHGSNNPLGDRIVSKLPVHCRWASLVSLLAPSSSQPSQGHVAELEARLATAAKEATKSINQTDYVHRELSTTVAIEDLSSLNGPPHLTVVDFKKQSEVLTHVQSAGSCVNFSSKRTYWLAGLSGGLGKSLCEWMVDRGARYFVISSRHPKIDQRWLDDIATSGAVIKISTCDIMRSEEVMSLYNQICCTMPAIAGVVQGAGLLHDMAIENMSLEDFLGVASPKVQGSLNLDQIFQQDSLDFFILFSSCVSLTGNPGQASYSAANAFMVALGEQRRKRGLATSVMNIGPVYGVGLITEGMSNVALNESVLRQGRYRPLSEQDFHEMFAEAVVSAANPSPMHGDMYTGIGLIREGEGNPPNWIADPIFSHLVRADKREKKAGGSKSRSRNTLQTQITGAESAEKQFEVIHDAILTKVRTIFQLRLDPSDVETVENMRLDELGIDSLLATEIRTWLYNGMGIDIPVLKMLGGITVLELSETTFKAVQSNSKPSPEEGLSASDARDGSLAGPVSKSEELTNGATDSSTTEVDTAVHRAAPTQTDANFDWEAETSLTDSLLKAADLGLSEHKAQPYRHKIVVALTGATGYLGNGLLRALSAEPNVTKIYCLAVRNDNLLKDIVAPGGAEKVCICQGDLSQPLLGLSEKDARDIMAEVDVVVHNGADTSLAKSYSTIRASNVDSTKELAQMIAQSGKLVPLHYISTVAVGNIMAAPSTQDSERIFRPSSIAHYKPLASQTAVAQGYISSKWVCEVFLERLSAKFRANWPIYIHRPSFIAVVSEAGPRTDFVHNIRLYSSYIGAVPKFTSKHIRGVIDIVPLEKVVEGVMASVLASLSPSLANGDALSPGDTDNGDSVLPAATVGSTGKLQNGEPRNPGSSQGVHFLHHLSGDQLRVSDPKSWMLANDNRTSETTVTPPRQELGTENEEFGEIQQLDVTDWTEKALSMGMRASLISMLRSLDTDEGFGSLVFPATAAV
ncbi:putative polyketide synthase [Nemania sp. NC0429]|nr:putative polyketide synthase [Nemania sp. NC0429]